MAEFEAGVFLVDKPVGPSSFDMVRKVRRALGVKKVGHAGTLDPFASGLLVICAGRPATRMISRLMEGEKEYLATLKLGVETTTQDPEGEIVAHHGVGSLDQKLVEGCLEKFRGEQQQVPPAYSALKHKGKPLYHYARRGIEVKKEPRRVSIRTLEPLGRAGDRCNVKDELQIRVVCSKGTYIRTLAFDIGRELGCGAYLSDLRRVRSGVFFVENAFPGAGFEHEGSRERFLAGALSLNDVCNLLQ